MRVFVTIPHFFGTIASDETNKSRQQNARTERLLALTSTITSLHQALGSAIYGLDHGQRIAWQKPRPSLSALDIVVCTSGVAHLIDEIRPLQHLFHHHSVRVNPVMLGFECHALLREALGRYDYYCYIEDDIVLSDPIFLKKRHLFDAHFGSTALLQPNRYELSGFGPIHKLYVDYRARPQITEFHQNISDIPVLEMPFVEDTIRFERTTYPSAGCFFLNGDQLARWIASPFFRDGDVSYLSPLDSAATLSIMKVFRIYKPALEHAWFLEVLHASPRWIASAARDVKIMQAGHNSDVPSKSRA